MGLQLAFSTCVGKEKRDQTSLGIQGDVRGEGRVLNSTLKWLKKKNKTKTEDTQRNTCVLLVGMQTGVATVENGMEVSQKIK